MIVFDCHVSFRGCIGVIQNNDGPQMTGQNTQYSRPTLSITSFLDNHHVLNLKLPQPS